MMAKQVTKSGLAGKLGAKLKQAVDKHKKDETKISGGGDLPAGIIGIAQLVDCRFGQYKEGANKGEYFFYAAGVVRTPAMFEGMPIKGMRTQIGPEPMCDTPTKSRKTLEDHTAWVLNEMRKLGAETASVDGDELEGLAAALKEAKPTFKFRTWKGQKTKQYPDPRVQHSWEGAADFTPDEGEVVEDETAAEEEESTDEEAGDEEVDLDTLAADSDD
jgi:hypothetical protein